MHVEKILELNGHSASIYTVDVTGKFIFTGSGDRFVAKWNLESGVQDQFSIRCDEAVYKIKLICDGNLLCIGTSSGSLHVIDLQQKLEIKHFIAHKSAIFSIEESPQKKMLFVGDAEGNLGVWNTETWEMLLFLPLDAGKIRCITCSADGESLYLACQDGSIRKFDTRNFNESLNWMAHPGGANTLIEAKESVNGIIQETLYTAGKDAYIRIWNIAGEPKLLRELPAHNFGIYQLLWMRENSIIVSASRDKSIKIWDTKTMRVLQKIERKQGGHSHAVNALSKINESTFVSVGDDKRICYWEIKA